MACVGAAPPLPSSDVTMSGTDSAGTTASLPPTGSATSMGDADSTVGCEPGTEGCACDQGQCQAELSCVQEVCVPAGCGNGMPGPGEDCDDGNAMGGDGCEPDCTFTPGAAGMVAGRENTCAWTHAGEAVCWGRGEDGQLGHGVLRNIGANEPARELGFIDAGGFVVQMGAGDHFTCARYHSGDVRCWGINLNGRLGQGKALTAEAFGGAPGETPAALDPIVLGGAAIDLAVGREHACAVREDGTVVCWGKGDFGRIGYGDTEDVGDDETPQDAGPVPLSAGDVVERVTTGRGHTCVLLQGGSIKCWGYNNHGQLGYDHGDDIGDDEGEVEALVAVPVGGPVVRIEAGLEYTCAILSQGRLRCWGHNNNGQLGQGNTMTAPPSAVAEDIPFVSFGGALVMDVAPADEHTCALLEGGSVRCWGTGDFGKLGYSDDEDRLSPADLDSVDFGTSVGVQISAGSRHSCVRRQDGMLTCWGAAELGRLGYGNANDIGDDEHPVLAGAVPFLP